MNFGGSTPTSGHPLVIQLLFDGVPLLNTKSYLLIKQGHLCLYVLKQFSVWRLNSWSETALVDLCLKERSSYLELCFDALKDLLAGYDL